MRDMDDPVSGNTMHATMPESTATEQGSPTTPEVAPTPAPPAEIGGRGGLDPTRFGDWEKNGRCIDF
jgi:hypothetical protein